MSATPLRQPTLAHKRVSILGSTGSIGTNTLEVIAQHPDRYTLTALTAHRNAEKLIEQAWRFKPAWVAISDETAYATVKQALSGSGTQVLAGEAGVIEAASLEADWVMAAMVGAAGLKPTLAAITQGHTVALANKESLVCAGKVMMDACAQSGATLLPVDSEHSAIFQVFDTTQKQAVDHITLTASGGAFLDMPLDQLANITPQQAVIHPNWNMGAKISIDSSTMMNKALEMIEAYHLFPLAPSQIEVLIHPESIVHSLVHYCDGSVLAQLGLPDMRTPIAYALGWPERLPLTSPRLDLAALGALHFRTPDTTRFRALELAQWAMEAGAWATITLNAANEIAVKRFMAGDIRFIDISAMVEKALNAATSVPITSIEAVMACDAEVRAATERMI